MPPQGPAALDSCGTPPRLPALPPGRSDGKPPPGFTEGQREKLLRRQAAYREWVGERLGRKQLVSSEHGRLGYRVTLSREERPFDVHIIGLDSAWAAGDDGDAGKLLLTDAQVGRLTTDGGNPLGGFRLALVHHPLADLADKTAAGRLIAANVDLLLRGHLHESRVETVIEPGRQTRQLAAGCLYESDRYPNGCHVLELTLDANGRVPAGGHRALPRPGDGERLGDARRDGIRAWLREEGFASS